VCFDFVYNFISNISHSKKNPARCNHKCTQVFIEKCPLFLSDFNEG